MDLVRYIEEYMALPANTLVQNLGLPSLNLVQRRATNYFAREFNYEGYEQAFEDALSGVPCIHVEFFCATITDADIVFSTADELIRDLALVTIADATGTVSIINIRYVF